ncbi:uncharacterized protein EV154DRAFT_482933 [Mucor mucedo]|uniref:uncharacterized protein n=1 Tax=Mucor mucedo TaxID=29922 RepID=UPI00221F0CC1|nr:uncharacterized protein EV154DRAFT_482933 [Mucor mucedo]KAI7889727.1 hypothetical protein EV154DRAFT_482933 [Mucor mucedo]
MNIDFKLFEVSAPLPALPPNVTKKTTTDLFKNYALGNNFDLIRVRFLESGVYRNTRELADANRQRQKDSYRCNYPYYIKIQLLGTAEKVFDRHFDINDEFI